MMVKPKLTVEQLAEREAYREFVMGFAEAAEKPPQQAEGHWRGFTRILTDVQRRELEAGGRESGRKQGLGYAKLFEGVEPQHL